VSEEEMARVQTPTGNGEERIVRIQMYNRWLEEWMIGYKHRLEE
jgi:phage FluMu gp28-like protein